MHSAGKWVGQLDKEQNPDSSNVTCNIRNGESRSTTDEKTRIKKERKKEKAKTTDSSRIKLGATNS